MLNSSVLPAIYSAISRADPVLVLPFDSFISISFPFKSRSGFPSRTFLNCVYKDSTSSISPSVRGDNSSVPSSDARSLVRLDGAFENSSFKAVIFSKNSSTSFSGRLYSILTALLIFKFFPAAIEVAFAPLSSSNVIPELFFISAYSTPALMRISEDEV